MAQITTAELATELHTDPRTVRKFLRADARERGVDIPGKGSRWSIEKREVRALRSRFAKWSEAQEQARQERAAKVEDAPETAPEAVDEVEALETDEEPSDDDLAMIENGDDTDD